jgi:hypothetical protein
VFTSRVHGKKLDARSLKGRLVGYEADGQLYRVLLDGGRTVIVSKHVKLCEDGSSQLLREDMSELDKFMDTAIKPSKPPKKSVRFCSEVMEHHIDEGPPASPGVSQPLRLGSGSVPALPVMQPTPHVSHASEFEPVVVPDVNVVDTSGEHSGALPEHPDQVQPEVTDTHPVNVQAEQEQRYPQRTRRPPGEWWNATANRDSDQDPTSEDGTALLTSETQQHL